MKFVKSFIVTLALLASTAASAHDNILEAAARRELMHATMGVQNPYRATCLDVQKEGIKANIVYYPGVDVNDDAKITLIAQYHDAKQMLKAIAEMCQKSKKGDPYYVSPSESNPIFYILALNEHLHDMPKYEEVLAASSEEIQPLGAKIKGFASDIYRKMESYRNGILE